MVMVSPCGSACDTCSTKSAAQIEEKLSWERNRGILVEIPQEESGAFLKSTVLFHAQATLEIRSNEQASLQNAAEVAATF